ncbi:MAG: hypothetical protein GY751_13855 [Bacteroidetes bacterium]|nr:hypothetical protein [Bacteroidota bacterium]
MRPTKPIRQKSDNESKQSGPDQTVNLDSTDFDLILPNIGWKSVNPNIIDHFAIDYNTNPHYANIESRSYTVKNINCISRFAPEQQEKSTTRLAPYNDTLKLRGQILSACDYICRFKPSKLVFFSQLQEIRLEYIISTLDRLNFGFEVTFTLFKGNLQQLKTCKALKTANSHAYAFLSSFDSVKHLKTVISSAIIPLDDTANKILFAKSDILSVPWNIEVVQLLITSKKSKRSTPTFPNTGLFTSRYIAYYRDTRVQSVIKRSRPIQETCHCYNCSIESLIIDRCIKTTNSGITRNTFIL